MLLNRKMGTHREAINTEHMSERTDSDALCNDIQKMHIGTRRLSPTFIITCASEPNSRKCSFKNRQNYSELSDKQRRNSMPAAVLNNVSVSFNDLSLERTPVHPISRLRSFKTTSKGVVNNGDSFRSNNSVMSSGSAVNGDLFLDQEEQGIKKQSRSPSDVSETSNSYSIESTHTPSFYRIGMLGYDGVGTTSLISQLMTSEYMGAYDTIGE